ncbi:hypothetical protein BDW22DRAFT_683992 [Trametopsis cervina]|nr:hypothetical protein BDW22DRAFT_683992 [Trametopsis cervina]
MTSLVHALTHLFSNLSTQHLCCRTPPPCDVRICHFVVYLRFLTLSIVYTTVAVFAAVRVYAIWGKNIYLCALVFTVGMIYPVYLVVALVLASRTAVCVSYGDALLNTSICIYTIRIYRVTQRNNFGPARGLSYLLLRDGTLYFSCFMALSAALPFTPSWATHQSLLTCSFNPS